MRHEIIYRAPGRYCAFPNIVQLRTGELLVGFRDAVARPPRSTAPRHTHLDSSSRAVCIRSADGGESWSEPTVIYDDECGVQHPGLMQTAAGTLLANFFKWRVMTVEPFDHAVAGTFVSRSADGGRTWQEPVPVAAEGFSAVCTLRACVQLPRGDLLVPLYENVRPHQGGRRAFVMRSTDDGQSWSAPVVTAHDLFGNIDLGESALLVLPSGKLLCLLRVSTTSNVAASELFLWQIESDDGGYTWTAPHRTPIWGYPPHLLLLRSGDILCSYGYRRPPYGVRACVSRDGGRTWDLEREIVLRADGLHGDLGYPTAVELQPGQILTVYYFHDASGVCFIAGTRYDLAESLRQPHVGGRPGGP